MRERLIAISILLFAARGVLGSDLQARIHDAAPGQTLSVPAGTYQGPIVVDKPLKLVAQNGAVIDGGGAGDVVILAAPDSELCGFIIRGSGDNLDKESTGVRVLGARSVIADNRFEDVLFGVDLKNAPDCVIRDNHISSKALDIARRGDALRLFRSDRCLIENNVIEFGRDALLWYSNKVVVRGNLSRNNRYGFHMMYSNDVTLENNDLTDNSVGIYLMYGKSFQVSGNRLVRNRGPSGYGIGLKEVDAYVIENNLFQGNRVGVYIDGSPYTRKQNSRFTRNVLACNDVGMALLPAVKGNKIYENSFIDNIEQLAVLGRGAVVANEFAVNGRGNFWSDYGGYDAGQDGVGDQPYQARKLFESLIDREPKLRLLLLSPAHDAIEFIGRALPAVRPEPKFADAHPLMTAPSIIVAKDRSRQGMGNLILAPLLLGFGGLIVLLAFGRQWVAGLITPKRQASAWGATT